MRYILMVILLIGTSIPPSAAARGTTAPRPNPPTCRAPFTALRHPTPAAGAPPEPTYRDLVYASRSPQNILDLYLPATPGPHPLVLWVHGGGWQSGDKTDTPALFLRDAGYAVASINYRLSGEAPFPAQIHDVKAAVRWLRAHAHDYDLAASRMGAWGSSAGGHLVALLGTAGDQADLEDLSMGNPTVSSRVQGVVDWYGPTDFLQMDAQAQAAGCPSSSHNAADSAESRLMGCPIQTCASQVARANPLTYVSPDDPPFLLHHGTADCVVAPGQSSILAAALTTAGVSVDLHAVTGAGHGGPAFQSSTIRQQVHDFFAAHLIGATVYLPRLSVDRVEPPGEH